MIVRKLRIQRGWSQDQLAQFSGLSVRTIQRIERGKTAGLESLKSLAAVFELNIQDLQQETVMDTNTNLSDKEVKIIEHVKDIKDFYSHLINYGIVVGAFFILNLVTSPDYIWAWWIAIGWGIGVISHALSVFEIINFFGADWEKKQIEKRLNKKL
ncbi:helix-turn-helix domain-containing protein [Colwellia demingiae]|uniref:Helix-turn-helix domain-containing protein n=1 Tax=Colwellia demingiae TaxID=89401 RepID=A0A5C6Q6D0_9GAMM|nr:helix-turn-helix domain-containing protein [Colwellia demingiae]TWX64504.1 helix-turn-helix domain-containing protein [Colwellia demingiae]